jgi:hypothetical protein
MRRPSVLSLIDNDNTNTSLMMEQLGALSSSHRTEPPFTAGRQPKGSKALRTRGRGRAPCHHVSSGGAGQQAAAGFSRRVVSPVGSPSYLSDHDHVSRRRAKSTEYVRAPVRPTNHLEAEALEEGPSGGSLETATRGRADGLAGDQLEFALLDGTVFPLDLLARDAWRPAPERLPGSLERRTSLRAFSRTAAAGFCSVRMSDHLR